MFSDKLFLNKGGKESGAPKLPKMCVFDLKNDFFAEQDRQNSQKPFQKNIVDTRDCSRLWKRLYAQRLYWVSIGLNRQLIIDGIGSVWALVTLYFEKVEIWSGDTNLRLWKIVLLSSWEVEVELS